MFPETQGLGHEFGLLLRDRGQAEFGQKFLGIIRRAVESLAVNFESRHPTLALINGDDKVGGARDVFDINFLEQHVVSLRSDLARRQSGHHCVVYMRIRRFVITPPVRP